MSDVVGKTLQVRFMDKLALVVHGAEPPSAIDWSAYCEGASKVRARSGGKLPTLVITEHGAAPNAAQRKEYADKVTGPGVRVAVLTDSTPARAVLTAMSWFNPDMKPFRLSGLAEALVYVDRPDSPEIHEALQEMRSQLGLLPMPHRSVG